MRDKNEPCQTGSLSAVAAKAPGKLGLLIKLPKPLRHQTRQITDESGMVVEGGAAGEVDDAELAGFLPADLIDFVQGFDVVGDEGQRDLSTTVWPAATRSLGTAWTTGWSHFTRTPAVSPAAVPHVFFARKRP